MKSAQWEYLAWFLIVVATSIISYIVIQVMVRIWHDEKNKQFEKWIRALEDEKEAIKQLNDLKREKLRLEKVDDLRFETMSEAQKEHLLSTIDDGGLGPICTMHYRRWQLSLHPDTGQQYCEAYPRNTSNTIRCPQPGE